MQLSVIGVLVQAHLAVLLKAGELGDQFGHVFRAFAQHVGGNARHAAQGLLGILALGRRAAERGDGWMPYLYSPERYTQSVRVVRDEAERAGSSPARKRLNSARSGQTTSSSKVPEPLM